MSEACTRNFGLAAAQVDKYRDWWQLHGTL